jgi:hypothetical protein
VIEKQIKRRNVDLERAVWNHHFWNYGLFYGAIIFEITYCFVKSPFPIIF